MPPQFERRHPMNVWTQSESYVEVIQFLIYANHAVGVCGEQGVDEFLEVSRLHAVGGDVRKMLKARSREYSAAAAGKRQIDDPGINWAITHVERFSNLLETGYARGITIFARGNSVEWKKVSFHGLDRKSQPLTWDLVVSESFCNGKLGSELYTVATFRLG